MHIPLELIKSLDLTGNKSIKFTDNDIEEILNYPKGAYTFMVLSLLYPNLKYGQVKFHQDHIHPRTFFNYSSLEELGISTEKINLWWDWKDLLPNLQLLEGIENEVKNKTPFKTWFEQNIKDKQKYMTDNYIPVKIKLELNYFEEFYNTRRSILKEKIKEILAAKNLLTT